MSKTYTIETESVLLDTAAGPETLLLEIPLIQMALRTKDNRVLFMFTNRVERHVDFESAEQAQQAVRIVAEMKQSYRADRESLEPSEPGRVISRRAIRLARKGSTERPKSPEELQREEMFRIAREEGKVKAIKYWREKTGWDLKDSKEFVEKEVALSPWDFASR